MRKRGKVYYSFTFVRFIRPRTDNLTWLIFLLHEFRPRIDKLIWLILLFHSFIAWIQSKNWVQPNFGFFAGLVQWFSSLKIQSTGKFLARLEVIEKEKNGTSTGTTLIKATLMVFIIINVTCVYYLKDPDPDPDPLNQLSKNFRPTRRC